MKYPYNKNLTLQELKHINKNKELLELIQTTKNNFKSISLENYNNMKLIRIINIKNLNSITSELIKELYTISETKEENKLYVFVGDEMNHFFCIGAYLKSFYVNRNNPENNYSFNNLLNYTMIKFKTIFENNSIFIWNGVTMGGGLAMGMYAKYRIATESTSLAMPESKFGYYANCFFNNFIHNILPVKEALHMCLLCYKFEGYEVYLKGFATNFILNKFITDLLEDLKLLENINDENVIEIVIKKYQDLSLLELDKSKSENRITKFNQLVNDLYDFEIDLNNFLDFYENLKYNLNKYDIKLYNEFITRSLHCLKINFEITINAYDLNLNFEDKYKMDYQACEISVKSRNFFEGIRAYFIEKDNMPKWNAKF